MLEGFKVDRPLMEIYNTHHRPPPQYPFAHVNNKPGISYLFAPKRVEFTGTMVSGHRVYIRSLCADALPLVVASIKQRGSL